jgi:hypothetical protein
MNLVYIVLVPLIAFVLYRRISFIAADIKTRNKSKLKADIFFLILSLVIIGFLIWLTEFSK